MATKIIAASIQVDAGNSNQVVKELNTNLDATRTGLKDAGDTIKETSGSFSNLKEQMSALPGPLKDAGEGVTALGDSFKALLANPVVLVLTAIVGALAFLYKSFTNTAEGGEKMEQVFAGIKAAAKAVLDAIFDLGGAIIKFFSGDFTGAFEQAKQAVTGVVDAVKNAYTETAKLTAQLQQIKKDQAQNDIDQAKRAKELAILREQATDPDVDIKARKAALTQLQVLAKEDAEKDIELAKRTAETKIGLLSIGKDAAKKNYKEIADAQIEQIQVETDAANEQRRIGKQLSAISKQERAAAKAEAAAAAAEAKKKREQDEAAEAQLRKIHEDTVLAGITDQYTKETQLLENKIADETAALKKEFTDGKLTRDQFNQLETAQEESAALRRLALIDKHNKELEDAEEKHQQELEKIKQAARDKEEKDRIAAEKKRLEDAKKHAATVLKDTKADATAKLAAVNAEQAAFKKAFDDKIITESEYNDEVEALATARADIKQAELQQLYRYADVASQTFDNLATIAGKQTAAGKAFSVASATIATIESAVKSFNAMADIPVVGPALGVVAAAAALASGYANVKKILSVDVPGQGGGSASLPSISIPTAPIAPSQSSTRIDSSSIDQLGQANSKIQIAPVKAYVVESDNAAAANRAARLQGAATLGGH